jgi:hypothetical protein
MGGFWFLVMGFIFFSWCFLGVGVYCFSASLCFFFYSCRRGERLTRRAVTFFFWQKKKLTKEKLPKFGDGLDARASGLCFARPNALA